MRATSATVISAASRPLRSRLIENRLRWRRFPTFLLGLLLAWSNGIIRLEAAAPKTGDPRVDASIARAVDYLKTNNLDRPFVVGLVTYTLLSAGEDPASPAVAKGLETIVGKCRDSGEYRPTGHHIYEATIDLLALEAADPELYLEQIEIITNYLLAEQEKHGGWFYPERKGGLGDTSITQYALLGLWAADRAGVRIENEVFERAAEWHFGTQTPGGGFTYHPAGDNPINRQIRGTMTLAGIGSLAIIRTVLFNRAIPEPAMENKANPLKFLERLNPDAQNKGRGERRPPKPIRPQIDKTIDSSYNWMTRNFPIAAPKPTDGNYYYYFYTMERAAALNGWTKFGTVDWYPYGVDILLARQAANGSFPEAVTYQQYAPSGTCFCVLFLLKATTKLIPQPSTGPADLGAGTLAGGRGLPDDLTKVEFKNGKLKTEEPALGDFNKILAGLSMIELPESEEDDAEKLKVDLTDPEKLVGDIDLLKRMAEQPEPQVRQVAAWALGKTDDMACVPTLVDLLRDPDLGVAIEARYSLCWIARLPNGLGHVPDPTAKYVDYDVAVDVKPIIKEWQDSLYKDWRAWYLEQRPYDERDDFDDPAQTKFRRKR